MGGSIFFSSKERKGSIFHIKIPTKFANVQEVKSLQAKNEPTGPDAIEFELAHIMVVDDSKMNLKVVEILLKNMPVCTTTENSGEEALEKVSSMEVDLILMDCQMPGMDGYQTTQHFRKICP